MWFDGKRQPNTIYVASTSRGKDSTAMLRAIELMGWPLDMIVSVDIWFDEETPAELPPMVAFKDEYDAKVMSWFGIPVQRLCATKPRSQTVNVERERESRRQTYRDIFYHITRRGKYAGQIKGFPKVTGSWCKKLKYGQTDIQRAILSSCETEDFHTHTHTPAGANQWIPSNQGELVQRGTQAWRIAGFPHLGCRWCTGQLKNEVQRGFRRGTGLGVQAVSRPIP